MCRNITVLRGLEPAATSEEIYAAALQYVRKVTGVGSLSSTTRDPIERAAAEVARITEQLLAEMPDRRNPPQTVPPLRRPEVRARLGLD
jgi:hypothetical protein